MNDHKRPKKGDLSKAPGGKEVVTFSPQKKNKTGGGTLAKADVKSRNQKGKGIRITTSWATPNVRQNETNST